MNTSYSKNTNNSTNMVDNSVIRNILELAVQHNMAESRKEVSDATWALKNASRYLRGTVVEAHHDFFLKLLDRKIILKATTNPAEKPKDVLVFLVDDSQDYVAVCEEIGLPVEDGIGQRIAGYAGVYPAKVHELPMFTIAAIEAVTQKSMFACCAGLLVVEASDGRRTKTVYWNPLAESKPEVEDGYRWRVIAYADFVELPVELGVWQDANIPNDEVTIEAVAKMMEINPAKAQAMYKVLMSKGDEENTYKQVSNAQLVKMSLDGDKGATEEMERRFAQGEKKEKSLSGIVGKHK